MDASRHIEQGLAAALAEAEGSDCPPRLAAAMRHAVFPGGARVRPRLCLAVASACREARLDIALGAAVAIELMHCASLVHDDLPCFDDASTRRGRPSVHRAFGERLAVLAGDALIVQAFHALVRHGARAPERLAPLLTILSRAAGAPAGITAGQAWECEDDAPLARYQRAKTGALFVAASMSGACACGVDPGEWEILGERLGEAYQVADDIRDVAADPIVLGKPVGRDLALGRPSAAHRLGLAAAVKHFEALVEQAMDSVPESPGAAQLRALIAMEAQRILPMEMRQAA